MKTDRPITILALLLCLSASLSSAFGAADPLSADGINWETNYYNPSNSGDFNSIDGLPDDAAKTMPVWFPSAKKGDAKLTLEDGYLTVDTLGGRDIAAGFSQSHHWNPLHDSTVEVCLRVRALAKEATLAGSLALFLGESGHQVFSFSPSTLRVLNQSESESEHDFSQWTTIRITYTPVDNLFRLYLDKQEEPVITVEPVNEYKVPQIQFGDLSLSPSVGGVVDWKYIRWTSNGAYPPKVD